VSLKKRCQAKLQQTLLYLQCMAAYGAASLAAGIAEKDVPLEKLAPAAAVIEQGATGR